MCPDKPAKKAPSGSRSALTKGGGKAAWRRLQPWFSLLVRLGLAAVAGLAAWPKLADLAASQRSVAAYRLFSADLNNLIGVAVPIIELALAVLLCAGLLTRYSAAFFTLLMVVYIAGIISAWSRGLSIDCGCFTPGGDLAPGEATKYGQDVIRDIGFAALGAYLTVWPRSKLSADSVMKLEPTPKTKDRNG
jgi:uncharacterized membrane protein YphA (DoxX/SURF4 family)